jgi:hypothetical protein
LDTDNYFCRLYAEFLKPNYCHEKSYHITPALRKCCGKCTRAVHNYTVIKESEWIIPHNDTISYLFSIYYNANALLLKRNAFDTRIANIAYPKDLIFKDGIIEADIASPNGGGYLGLALNPWSVSHRTAFLI